MKDLKSLLQASKPYFEVEWSEGETIRVSATTKDQERFRRGSTAFAKRCSEFAKSPNDLSSKELEKLVRDGFRLNLGKEDGDALLERCMATLTDGDPAYSVADCATPLVYVITALSQAWKAHADEIKDKAPEVPSDAINAYLEEINGGAEAI